MSPEPRNARNPYSGIISSLQIRDGERQFFNLKKLNDSRYDRLPFSVRVLLEATVRHCDEFHVTKSDVENVLNWERSQSASLEFPFQPARVLLQDFTGVPAVVDLAAMRDTVQRLGGDPENINPQCPVDLVIDHSVQVDRFGDLEALETNQKMEFQRNQERFLFLKWGAKAFKNMLIVPPGSGIVHQVNLEYLARIVFCDEEEGGLLYPDSVVGTDSHTTMICGSGVLGWGVGGIEAEAVMLGQPISMVIPEVVGFKLIGSMPPTTTSTDLVLTVTKNLRDIGVVGKFVEFFGPAVQCLSIADRATIANMCPEYGATVGYFPVDVRTLEYLRQTGRKEADVERIEAYLRAVGMFRDYTNSSQDPIYTKVVELDLSQIVPCVSGPKRPHDRVPISNMKEDFRSCLTAKLGFKGFGVGPNDVDKCATITMNEEELVLKHGSVVIAAITSCTNTSNPSVMLGAGLMAKKAVEKGLGVKPYTKTSLSPGSGVVTKYLLKSGLLPYLEQLGFFIAGYGCMTCIGNSGPLPEPVAAAIDDKDLVVAGVLSGNRNFEGRVHPQLKANYLAAPPLVVAYALAGRVDIDFENDPIGTDQNGVGVFLRDIWPSKDEIDRLEQTCVLPAFFQEVYAHIQDGSAEWQSLSCPETILYPWDSSSTYIRRAPFFDSMTTELEPVSGLKNAFVLLNLGDSVTTDHISPAGSISKVSPAARYLMEKGLAVRDFNTYGARRGNDEVMVRGTFANIRLINKLASRPGPKTLHVPTNEEIDVFDAAERYRNEGHSVIILAGKDYGSGSSRDWAAKGPYLQGVKAVIAESFERIHRSNLVGMGLIPLQFLPGQSADVLGLSGKEKFSMDIPNNFKPGQKITITSDNGLSFQVDSRFDTEIELEYFRNGGILQYMIRKLLKGH